MLIERFKKARALVAASLLAAAAAATATAGEPGMVVLVSGGGAIRDALFNPNTPIESDATFSLHAGYDKDGKLKGHFTFKRVFPGQGVRAVISSEVTELDWGFDECPWVAMSGVITLHATWVSAPIRPEYFTLQAWDCDGVDDAPDRIWFATYRDEALTNMRPALTLAEPAEISGGGITIR